LRLAPSLIGFVFMLASSFTAAGGELPTIGILSPSQGASLTGPDVTVEVAVTDFVLVPPMGTGDTPGEGHVIYFLDFEPPFVPGQPAIPDDPNVVYAATHETSYTFQDVSPGSHEIIVLLVLDNHAPALPPAIDKVSFTVVEPAQTPEEQPTPVVTETARTIDVQPDTPVPTPEPSSSPSPAVLPMQVPPTGTNPDGSGGPNVWMLVTAVAGALALVGSAGLGVRYALGNGRKRDDG
jgi:hypothetical protein